MVEAATGSEGIDETIRTRPHVVLLDLELPDIDGLIVLKRLREWGQVPVLVVSPRIGFAALASWAWLIERSRIW